MDSSSLSSDSSLALGRILTSHIFSGILILPEKHVSPQGSCPLLDVVVHGTVLPVSGCGTADAESTQSMMEKEKEFTPQSIPKTILFIDGKANAPQALIDRHFLIGYSPPQASSVVEEFRSFTLSHNKDRIFDEFRKADSNIRILVALGYE